MTHCKKLLSVILCLAMVLGTLTAGLMFVSAAEENPAVPTYASLQSKYKNKGGFFYSGVEFLEGVRKDNGDNTYTYPAVSDGNVAMGSTLTVRFYVKTNYTLYKGQYFIVIDNKYAMVKSDDEQSNSDVTAGTINKLTADIQTLRQWSGDQAGFYKKSPETIYIKKSNGDYYTKDEIDGWYILGAYDTKSTLNNTPRTVAQSDEPLFEFELKLKNTFTGSFNVFLVPESFTALDGGVRVTKGYSCLEDPAADGSTQAKAATKADNFELQGQQTFSVNKTAVFKDVEGNIIDEQPLAQGDSIKAPAVSDLYGWADVAGNIVDLSEATMGDTSVVYTAILNSYEVDANLVGNGGTIDGKETKTIKVKIGDGFDPTKYTATKAGETFYGWAVGKKLETVYRFTSINPVDIQALWDENILKVYVPTNYSYVTDEDTGIEVKVPGGLVPLCEVFGLTGEKLTAARGAEILEIAKAALVEKGEELTGFGFEVFGEELSSVSFTVASVVEDDGSGGTADDNVDHGYKLAGLTAKGLKTNPVIFGETTGLLLSIEITQSVNFHYPAFDEDGNWDGESWIDYKLKKDGASEATATEASTGTDAATGTEPSEDQYEDYTIKYKTIFDFSQLSDGEINFDKIRAGYYKGAPVQGQKQYEGAAYDPEAGFTVKLAKLKTIDNDPNTSLKYHYYYSFVDGQGNKIDLTDDKLSLEIKSTNYSMRTDDEGNSIPAKNVFDVYTYPYEREYNFAFNAVKSADDVSINKYLVAKNFKYGAEITAADLAEIYSAEPGSAKVTMEELKKDGEKVNLQGYFFKEVLFMAEGMDEINFTEGGTLILDGAFIDALTKIQGGFTTLYETSVITVTGVFEPRSFDFVIKYTNAEGKVVELTKLTFKGNETFKFATVINAELRKKIDGDCQTGRKVNADCFVDKDGNDVYDVNAFKGPYELFIKYTVDDRMAFIDFANGKEDGYRSYTLPYGTPMYREDYDPEKAEAEYGADDYRFNKYLLSGDTVFATKPLRVQQTDDDGNPVYEPLYREVKDEEGNVVKDDVTGEPKMEIVKDEEGNTVYDESKPVYKDPKGETAERPYRNSEFMGTKVYHLASPVFSWADVPDQSEWIEGYENENCELYTTDILQLQWKPDTDFLLRIYNTDGVGLQLQLKPSFSISMGMNGNLYSALGRDFKWYYWDSEGRPCKKGEGMLNTKPDEQIIILLWPTKETIALEDNKPVADDAEAKSVSSWYLTAIPLGKDFFKPSLIPTLLPTILKAVRGLIN